MNLKNAINIMACLMLFNSGSQARTLDEALVFYHQNEDQKALELLQKIDSADAKMYQAEILMNIDLDDAEETIESATEAYPEHAGLQYWRGRIMGEQAGSSIFSAMSYAKKSLSSFQKAAELAPENPEYQTGLMMFYLNAPSFAGGDQDKALAIVDKIKHLDEEEGLNAQVRYVLSSNDKNPFEELSELTANKPDYASVQFQMAQWHQRLENYEKAFSSYQKALAKLTKDEDKLQCSIWYQQAKTTVLSKSEFATGEQAINQYLEQCEISRGMPDKEWASFRSANILELNGKPDEAQRIYKSLKSTSDKELKKQLKKKV